MHITFQNQFSEYFELRAGVPQGSVLAPTPFILYTNDLPDPVQRMSLTLQYADDVTQLISAQSHTLLHRHAQQELDRVTVWEHKWRIQANANKCHITHFPSSHRAQHIRFDSYTYTFPPRFVPVSNTNKVLAVNYDNILHIHHHINQKAAYAQACLRQSYRFRSSSTKMRLYLYKTLVLPHLTYSPLTLSLAYTTNTIHHQVYVTPR